ncbi:MAG: ATP-binding protein [Nakamurella sp.]
MSEPVIADRLVQWPSRWSAAHVLAALSGIFAILALIGWAFDVNQLMGVVPGKATMKVNTAASILLISASWFVPKRAAVVLTMVAGGIALITLLEYLGVGVSIDNLVIRDTGPTAHPGRMSVITGSCILLLAWSLGMMAAGRRRFVQLAATVSLGVVGLALLAFLFDVPSLFSVDPFSTLALPTAVALGMLSAAALLTVPGGSMSWMLHGSDAGARILRVLLAWTLVGLPVFGYLRLLAEHAGWYGTNFGTTLMVASACLVLTVAAWIGARTLSRVDIRRAAALAELQALASQLDQRVRRRTAELELERESLLLAEAAARSAHAQSEWANAAKDQFLSRMSHELRTPLNAVLGFGQLLESEDLTADQAESVGHILGGGRRLLEMIDELLDISGIVSGSAEFAAEAVQVRTLVQETIDLVGPAADAGGVGIQFDCGQCSEQYLWADRYRLKQVLFTLLSNGIKYNHVGGRVVIGIGSGEVGFLSLTVSDTGSGMSATDLPGLFDSSDRVGLESTEIERTGVGLALAKRLVTGMGGRIHAEATAGIGSTFTMTIPAAEPTESRHALPAQSAPRSSSHRTASPVGP